MQLYTQNYIKEIILSNLQEFNYEEFEKLGKTKELQSYIDETAKKAFEDLNSLLDNSNIDEFSAWETIRESILFKG